MHDPVYSITTADGTMTYDLTRAQQLAHDGRAPVLISETFTAGLLTAHSIDGEDAPCATGPIRPGILVRGHIADGRIQVSLIDGHADAVRALIQAQPFPVYELTLVEALTCIALVSWVPSNPPHPADGAITTTPSLDAVLARVRTTHRVVELAPSLWRVTAPDGDSSTVSVPTLFRLCARIAWDAQHAANR